MGRNYDVVIVGAGAIGCCIARELAVDHDVLVLAKDRITESASANASAFISDWWYFLQGDCIPGVFENIRAFFQELDGTGGFIFNEHPYVRLIEENERRIDSKSRAEKMKNSVKKVKDISYYSKYEISDRWSNALNLDGFEGGIVDDRAGYIEPTTYLEAMKMEAEDRGADFRMDTEVTDIASTNEATSEVTVNRQSETIRSGTAIVAAGTHSESLVSKFTDLPTRPFMICGHRLEPNQGSATDIPITTGRGMFVGPDAFGSLTVAGGEYWIDNLNWINNFPRNFPDRAHEHVVNRLPQVLQGYTSEADIQYRPDGQHRCPEGITITPDQMPVIDTVDDHSNVIVADGSRGAVSLAPAISTVIRSLLTGDESPIPRDPFRIDRFDTDAAEFDLPLITNSPTQ